MRLISAALLVCSVAIGPAQAISELEYVPAYVAECPALALNSKRYEAVLVGTLALSSNALKAKNKRLPTVYIEPGKREAFCRDVIADYGPNGRKIKGLVRRK